MNAMEARPKITALAPWFGSNRTLAHAVGEALEGCRWVGVPFAGGMAELVHIEASTIAVNDTHRHIINLATCLKDKQVGFSLYRKLRRVPFHPEALAESQDWCKEHPKRPIWTGDEEAAYHYFVACWMNRSATAGTDGEFSGNLPVRWNANGGDSNTRYRSAVSSLVAWRRILQRCNFTVMDCFEFLTKCKDESANGIYCDPPFPEAGRKYRHNPGVGEAERAWHSRLSAALANFKRARVVCRFYDHPLIRQLYTETQWRWMHFTGRKQSNADGPEVLLLNRLGGDDNSLF